MSLPTHFHFREIIEELNFAAEEALKAERLHNAATTVAKAMTNLQGLKLSITDKKLGIQEIGLSDYAELERLFFEMLFVTLNARIEQIMTKLFDELTVYENWIKEGKTDVAANTIRRLIVDRPSNNISKPQVVKKVQEKFKTLLGTQPNDVVWKYILDCYGRRDKIMHGKDNVPEVKKELRLRDGAISKLAGHVKWMAKTIQKKLAI